MDSRLVQVFFRKSPTGAPFFLAYNQGEHGWVRPQKAAALLKAGIIDPIKVAEPLPPAEEYVPSVEVEKSAPASPDMTTTDGVKAVLGTDLEALREYCDQHGINVHHAVKRPETFWRKIAKYHAK